MESWWFTGLILLVYFGWALALSICGHGVSPRLWPFACATFPSGCFAKWGLPLRQEVDTRNWPEFIFDPRRKFRLGESVRNCFSFTSPWGLKNPKRSAVSRSDRIMRLLKCAFKKNIFFFWERLRVCKRENSKAGKKDWLTQHRGLRWMVWSLIV